MIAAVGRADEPPLKSIRIPTGLPGETLTALSDFFLECRTDGLNYSALGIGSFGPIRNGVVLATPKKGWEGTDISRYFQKLLGVPVACETDVNAAALAEALYGAGRKKRTVLYVTVGTGIGGGLCQEGRVYSGMLHPELGHIPLKRNENDSFSGDCPFHGDCWEGLASGPAVEKRWKIRSVELPPDHPAWNLEAFYLAQGFLAMGYTLQPDLIVFGGGLSAVPGLLEKTRVQMKHLSGGYLGQGSDLENWDSRLVLPELSNPGLYGAFLLAEAAASHGP